MKTARTDDDHEVTEGLPSPEEKRNTTVAPQDVMKLKMDKTPAEDLKQDLCLPQFDRNLTVEKAHFGDSGGKAVVSTAEPSLPPGNGSEGRRIRAKHGRELPPPTKKRSPKRSFKTQKNVRPSEYFHRNLADAVSNAELSDEAEQYIYPYYSSQYGKSNSTTALAPIKYQQLRPIHPSPGSDPGPGKSRKTNGLLREVYSSPQVDTDLESGIGRPMMRSLFKSRPYGSPPLRGVAVDGTVSGGYSSDDEQEDDDYNFGIEQRLPLLGGGRPIRRKPMSWINILKITLGAAVLMIGAAMFWASSLEDVEADLGRVLSSSKELIFDFHVKAINPNWWTVKVTDVDLGVFGFSKIVPLNTLLSAGSEPVEFLGRVTSLDEALAIPSRHFEDAQRSNAISQVHIRSPGVDKNGNEHWTRIIRYPYGLVVRGVLQYRPFLLTRSVSAAICDVVLIDPTTGVVSKDPDQTYCAGDSPHPPEKSMHDVSTMFFPLLYPNV